MKAAVQRVIVLLLALRTHSEGTHGGFGTVVRNVLYYGEPGTAISTVGERIAVAPVFRTDDFLEASLTGGDIRGNQLVLAFLCNAAADFEPIVVCGSVICNRDMFYASQRRRVVLKLQQETLQVVTLALDFNLDVFGGIAHPAI